VRDALVALDPDLPGVRWVQREKLHLTLLFLGDVEIDREMGLREALAGIQVGPFWLPVAGLGSFGRRDRPAVLWVGTGRGHPHLFALRKAIADAALAAGLEPDLSAFVPHFTVARCRPVGTNPGLVRQFLKTHAEFDAGSFPVSRFQLFSSAPGPGGTTYVVQQEFPLLPR
jgi:2'-5' RNA ligase